MAYSNHTSFATAEQGLSSISSSESYIDDQESQSPLSDQKGSNIVKTKDFGNHNNMDQGETSVMITQIQLSNRIDVQHQPSLRSSYSSDGLESSNNTIFENDLEINRVTSEKLSNDYGRTHYSSDTIRDAQVPLVKPETHAIAWVLLFFVVILRAATAIFNNTFTPIPLVTAQFLGVSLTSINWLYNATFITFMISCFFTSWLYDFIGIKWSLALSGVILSVGCWIRWIAVKMSPPSFIVLMIGHIVASFSAPISLNMTTTFAALWFTENLRATASMFIVSNYGAIIAMFLLPKLATGSDKIELTIIVVACIATGAAIPFFFFPKKPRTATSYDMYEDINKDSVKPKISLRHGALQLLKNPHFLTLSMIHGLNTGISNAWSVVMNQAITPYGYSDSQVGNIAAIGVIGGILGCLISGPVLDKTKQHKILLKIMTPLMFSTYVAFIFVVKAESFAAILYVNFLNQFFLNFMVPICIELGVEVSYPVPESLSTSILWQISQILGIILTTVMDLLRDSKNDMFRALVFQAVVAGVCFIFSCVFNGPMLRLKSLQDQEKLRKEALCAIQPTSKLLGTDDAYPSQSTKEDYSGFSYKSVHV